MRAVELQADARLRVVDRPVPEPARGELRVAVEACAVCRTDLHILDAELPPHGRPRVLGHQIVGIVDAVGEGVDPARVGTRVGVPWLGRSCGKCAQCARGRENLCDAPTFTGYDVDGGFAEKALADARFCMAIPAGLDPVSTAPLLCGGLIGYRAYRMCESPRRLGLYGFGSAAHILAQLAIADGVEVFAFTRAGDDTGQAFARELGCAWAGPSDASPPGLLDAAILFAPDGALVPVALRAVGKGGIVVCGGIHMSDIPSFPYEILWGERVLRSVANLTRDDGRALFEAVGRTPVRTTVHRYALEDLPKALEDLRRGRFRGTAVVVA